MKREEARGDRLHAVTTTFHDAVTGLMAFVDDSRRSIQEISHAESQIRSKLSDLKAVADNEGRVLGISGPDVSDVELDRDETTLLVEVMDWKARLVGRYPEMLLNMAFIYLVALFDAFASDALRHVLITRPDLMKSR